MPDSESRAPAPTESHSIPRRGSRFRLNAIWIGVALIVILSAAQLIGIIFQNLNQTRMGAIFAIGVVSFLGTLSLGHQGRRYHPFESSEVRTALTTAFAMVFFAAVAIFLFSTNTVHDFGRTLMSNLTSLFGVVIGFYFASSAVVEYGKIRAGAGKDTDPASGDASPPPLASTSALEAKLAELEATVARLTAASAAPDGHEKPPAPAPTEPIASVPRD
ncbi:MAG: hypothetical protein M3Q23_15950 [Actinomycetota bacterium]|nr:hypothetical protein [Actinomycetota bacterium]